MIVLAAIVVAVLLLAPSHAASAPPPVVVAPITSASSAADAAPIPAPEVGTLMTQGSLADVIDMVPGKPPTPRYPAGTMFVGSVVDDGDRGPAAKLYEWDVARAAIVDVRTIRLDDANGKIDPGAPSAIRLAKDGDQVISVVEASGGAHALSAEGWVHSMGSRASIAGERGLVAVAYYEGTSRALEIELFHPSFYGADVLGHTRLDGGDRVAAGQRPAALTFLHGRLYVATRPNAFETVVAELQIPSLRVLGTFRHRRESTKHARSQLFARDERFVPARSRRARRAASACDRSRRLQAADARRRRGRGRRALGTVPHDRRPESDFDARRLRAGARSFGLLHARVVSGRSRSERSADRRVSDARVHGGRRRREGGEAPAG